MNIHGITSATGLTASELAPQATPLTPAERARAARLHGAALRHASPAEQGAAVSAQFEAILLRQLLGKTVEKMLGSQGGPSASIYGDLLTDSLATQLSAGSGMGLAGLIEKQLAPRAPASAAPGTTAP